MILYKTSYYISPASALGQVFERLTCKKCKKKYLPSPPHPFYYPSTIAMRFSHCLPPHTRLSRAPTHDNYSSPKIHPRFISRRLLFSPLLSTRLMPIYLFIPASSDVAWHFTSNHCNNTHTGTSSLGRLIASRVDFLSVSFYWPPTCLTTIYHKILNLVHNLINLI